MSKDVNFFSALVHRVVSWSCDTLKLKAKTKSKIKDHAFRLKFQLVDLKRYITRLDYRNLLHELLRPERRMVLIMSSLLLILLSVSVSIQAKGSILPVDKDVVRAFKMLESTTSGRKLIKKVRNVTRGSYIYLTIGNTERDNLMDECGEKVRGLTRVDFRMSGRSCSVGRVTVITNRDLVGGDVYEIVKSLAFELENVYQVFDLSCTCPWMDSPQAPLTQARVIEELGISN